MIYLVSIPRLDETMDDDSDDLPPDVARHLRAYGALDNPLRLKAYRAIRDVPEVPFSEIARRLGVASGLAAYHLGLLKAAGLVDVVYARKGLATSRYVLTDWGEQVFGDLFGKPGRGPKAPRAKPRSRAAREPRGLPE